ncbi:metal-dependent hydrolase [Candidatus Woesearchaeota archaeon]|nr:metal-dependent hydrolase [Candidatus Woesearchaeota archaeon]
MKGKNHLISGIIVLFAIMLFDLFLGLKLYSIIEQNVAVTIISLYLFFAGLLLPDADKTNSWIFKFFLPFALVSWLTGLMLSFFKGKKFRHRGVLHSFKGMFLTSVISAILSFLMMSLFIDLKYEYAFLFFLVIILGQLIHLVLD